MVVGGVPEASKIHAQQVANQGLDMVEAAMEVNSPATGKPLQVVNYIKTQCCGLIKQRAEVEQ